MTYRAGPLGFAIATRNSLFCYGGYFNNHASWAGWEGRGNKAGFGTEMALGGNEAMTTASNRV